MQITNTDTRADNIAGNNGNADNKADMSDSASIYNVARSSGFDPQIWHSSQPRVSEHLTNTAGPEPESIMICEKLDHQRIYQ